MDRYTELVDPDLDARRGPRQGRRGAAADAAQRHPDARAQPGVHPASAPASTSTSPSRSTAVAAPGCYSPANAEGAPQIELTVGRHDGGLVSTYLCDHARPGMVVGLDSVGGDFVLPAAAAAAHPVRLRRQRHHPGDVDAAHTARRGLRPARSPSSTTRAVRRGGVLPRRARRHARRSGAARLHPLHGRRRPGRARSARAPGRRDARARRGVRLRPAGVGRRPCASIARTCASESFVPPVFDVPAESSGGRVTFADSGVERRRRRPAAAGAGRGRGPDPRKRMPDGHLPQLHPPQDPRRGAQPHHRRGVERRRRRTCRSACPSPSATSTSRSRPKGVST